MKLYATITSERATKGQGGNQYINTELYVGDAQHPYFWGKIKLYIENGLYCLDYYPLDGEIKPLARMKEIPKAKRQKGEKDERYCHLCGSIEKDKYCTNKSCYEYKRYE